MTKEEASEFMTKLTVYVNMLILKNTTNMSDKEKAVSRIMRREQRSELIKLLVTEED